MHYNQNYSQVVWLTMKIEIMQLDLDYATPMVVVRSTMELGIKWFMFILHHSYVQL